MGLIIRVSDAKLEALKAAETKSDRQLDFIAKHVREAEKVERGEAHANTPIRYEWQRQLITEDTDYDNSRESVEGRTTLPVKEYVISRDGTLTKEIRGAALEMLRQKKFCSRCEERQPESEGDKRVAWSRTCGVFGTPPAGVTFDSHCVFCWGQLGVSGSADEPDFNLITPEQLKLMMEMGIEV